MSRRTSVLKALWVVGFNLVVACALVEGIIKIFMGTGLTFVRLLIRSGPLSDWPWPA